MVKKLLFLGLLFFGLSQSPIFGQYVLESDIPLQYSGIVTPLRECVDKALQNKLIQELNANPKWKKLIADKKMAVGLVDLRNPTVTKFARVNGNVMMYAASLPKIAILLAATDALERKELPESKEILTDLRLMISKSDNHASTRMIDRLGYEKIEAVLTDPRYQLYDEEHGGGLWVGKRYASAGARYPDPIKGLSHAATVSQVCRFYYLLVNGKLINYRRSKQMLDFMADPALHHKFVNTLDKIAPDAELYRKSGSWKNFHSDSILVWGHDWRRYILVALVEDPEGESIIRQLVLTAEAVLKDVKQIVLNSSFIEALKNFVQNTFGLREGETLRALLMQANIFLLISTLLMVKPTANALFLDKIGVSELPIAFILVAISAAVISTFYSRGLNNRSLSSIIYWTLYSSIFGLIIFGVLLRLNFLEGWILYLFYIWVSLFAVLSASQFWIMANLVFNAREAKRLFGFIGAGAIAGGIFGGYLTTLLAPLIGSENLLFVCAAFLALCVPIVRSIWRRGQVAESGHLKHEKRVTKPSKHPFRLILQSRHLTYLASIIGVSVIVAKLVDYQFSAMATVVILDPDELTAFFGFWFSTFNLVSLLIQLFLTARLVGVFGVGTSLLFLPGGILLGAILLFFIPELWAAVFIKLMDGSLKQSVNKAGIELIALPIPAIIKNQTKTYIDVFIDSVATGISGLILIFVINGLHLNIIVISAIIALLVGTWIYFVIKIKGAYLESFRQKVDEVNELPSNDQVQLNNRESILGGLSKVLNKGSEKQIIYALKKLKEIQDERLYKTARQLLTHPSADIRALALQTLYYFKNQPVLPEAYQLTNDPSQKVKISAFQYLIEHHRENLFELMERFLNEPDEKVSSAALISLAKETRDNYVLKSRFALKQRIQQQIDQLDTFPTENQKRFHHISLLKAIGYADLSEFYPFIRSAFDHPGKEIVKNAILAAGYTTNAEMIPLILKTLEEEHLSATAIQALCLYGPGITPILEDFAQNHPEETLIIKEFPKVLESIPMQGTVDVLFKFLDWSEGNVRLSALRALNKLKIQAPHLNYHPKDILVRITEEARIFKDTLSILYVQNAKVNIEEMAPEQQARQHLVSLLEKRLNRHLERIFRLLGLKYPPDDVLKIYNSLHSGETDHRVTALEFLDNLLENNLKKVLIPIIETALLDSISAEAIRDLRVKIPNEEECLGLLLKEADVKVKLAVLSLLANLPGETYRQLIVDSTNSPHEKVRQTALKILQNLDSQQSLFRLLSDQFVNLAGQCIVVQV